MIKTLRDRGLKHMLNSHPSVNKIASILEISLRDGEAKLKILLKGEEEPISLSLNYAIEDESLRVSGVKSDREWVNGLAGAFEDKYAKISLGKYGKLAWLVKHLI
ncbi:MAG: hypothetical protein FWB85_08765 [Chitinispirillia bacterium]|nr:hypothetical protein [Chitinispirillia bacterium]